MSANKRKSVDAEADATPSKCIKSSSSALLKPSDLWSSTSSEAWQQCVDAYHDGRALAASFAIKKSRPASVNSLAAYKKLDAGVTALKDAKFITRDQLLDAVNWKHTRGKLRPNFNKVASNTDSKVIEASKAAFAYLDSNLFTSESAERPILQQALSLFSDPLFGVGPATASALLTAARPERFAFASDELLHMALQGKKPAYTVPEILECCIALRKRAKTMQNAIALADLERAVFASHMLSGQE
jgi:hypothetical protein